MPDPIAGPLFNQASRVKVHGAWRRQERRLLLLCIAGYQDAGHAPSVRELADRIGVRRSHAPVYRAGLVDALLAALEADGQLTVDRMWPARNSYRLQLDGNTRARGSKRSRRAR